MHGTLADSSSLGTDGDGRLIERRIRIRVVSGAGASLEQVLERGSLLVGSNPASDISLADRRVSRSHLEIALVASGVRLRDLGSTNGTFVGDSRIESVVVRPPVEVRLGAETRIELTADDVPAPVPASSRTRFGRLVGTSTAMRRLFGLLERIASTDVPLLLEGEAGVGKSEAAQAVHAGSARGAGPLEVVDVRAGWRVEELEACFGRAAGGTVVVDHVDAIARGPAMHLSSLLDRAERGELDVRSIATSRADLRSAVEQGRFDRHLYFQVATVRAIIPPLRDRLEDVETLARELAAEITGVETRVDPHALSVMASGDLTGNVRELRARLEEHLMLREAAPEPPDGGREPAAGLGALPFKDAKEQVVDTFERDYVRDLLERHGGNISRAAEEAGISRNHLSALVRKHSLR